MSKYNVNVIVLNVVCTLLKSDISQDKHSTLTLDLVIIANSSLADTELNKIDINKIISRFILFCIYINNINLIIIEHFN